ncbi:MAG: four helix bundle protein [Xanthomonadales bacterium]|nr:four helix bundle protein [Xanthomonadales bacterium]
MSDHFRELEVWQAAMRLAGTAHALADVLGADADADAGDGAGLAATLKQAAATIPDQIARGHADGDLALFAQCLAVAQDACATVADRLQHLHALFPEHAQAVGRGQELAAEVGRMLARLHQALTRKLQADAVTAPQQR